MKVILITDVKKVGQRGAVVEVADGYAQNVLIPKRLAMPATPANLKQTERKVAAVAEKRAMDTALAKKTLDEVDGKTVVLKVRANEAGGLFETVRTKQVAEALVTAFKVTIPVEALSVSEPLKKLGSYEVRVEILGARATVYLQLLAQ